MALRGTGHHIIRDEDGDEDMGTAVALVQGSGLRSGGDGGGSQPAKKGSQETAITPQRPHYGLPETITQVIPSIFYFSAVADPNKDVMQYAQFRLTSATDQMISALSTPVANADYSKGLYNMMLPVSNAVKWGNPHVQDFPTTGAPDQSQWRDYFHKMYQYYRVLGVEYEFTIQNPQYNIGNDIVIGTIIDTYSSANATNVHPLNETVTPSEAQMWPDSRWTVVKSSIGGDQETNWGTIKGYYRPGLVHVCTSSSFSTF